MLSTQSFRPLSTKNNGIKSMLIITQKMGTMIAPLSALVTDGAGALRILKEKFFRSTKLIVCPHFVGTTKVL